MDKNSMENRLDLGLLILRLGIGITFAFAFGLPKMEGGPALWEMIGGSMSNVGITFAPTFWGFMASITEFGGGILLILGLFTRPVAALSAFVMIMATIQHLSMHDQWYNVMSPASYFAVFAALLLMGAGRYSLDSVIFRKRNKVVREETV